MRLLFIWLALLSVSKADALPHSRTKKNSNNVSPETICTGDDRAFVVTHDIHNSYTTRQDIAKHGEDVYCFNAIVTRTEASSDLCSGEDLEHVVFAVDSNHYDLCASYCTSLAGCSCNTDAGCCATSIEYNASMGLTGIEVSFSTPIEKDDDEVEVHICLDGISETESSVMAFYGVGIYANAYDQYEMDAFCPGVHRFAHHVICSLCTRECAQSVM